MPRKKPFSGKQKKKQLQDKRMRKQDGPRYLADLDSDDEEETRCNNTIETQSLKEAGDGPSDAMKILPNAGAGGVADKLMLTDFNVQKIHEQPERNSNIHSSSINNFRLHFFRESDQAIERRKRDARKPIKYVDKKQMELKVSDVYPSDVLLDFPKRPAWDYSFSKDKLDVQEQDYFKRYISGIIGQKKSQEMSYFELNLETWRQLWRVLELSDILLIICDARYPVLHLPPSLIHYVAQDLHKFVIIILNKIDFLPPILVSLWKSYLESQFPGTRVVLFSSFLKEMRNDSNFFDLEFTKGLNKKTRQGSSLFYGPQQLLEACQDIVKEKVDLSSWRKKLEEDGLLPPNGRKGEHQPQDEASMKDSSYKDENEEEDVGLQMAKQLMKDATYPHKPLFSNGILSLGCIGFPNAGKSSVLNTLVGRKVVSVSQTPGRTKHFQTIFLSPTVKLCDCPGLVFPSLIPKALQVIAGIFPVAHVREPYSVVGYLARRLDLPGLLNLHPPDASPKKIDKNSGKYIWSAYSICEAWALKNGFTTSKAGRPDLYRAANKILRMAVDGQICLYFSPPDYAKHIEQARADPILQSLHDFLMTSIPGKGVCDVLHEEIEEEEESTDEDEEEDPVSTGLLQNIYLPRDINEGANSEISDNDEAEGRDDDDEG